MNLTQWSTCLSTKKLDIDDLYSHLSSHETQQINNYMHKSESKQIVQQDQFSIVINIKYTLIIIGPTRSVRLNFKYC